MSGSILAQSRIRAGKWEAELAWPADGVPQVEVWHDDRKLPDVTLGDPTPDGGWPVTMPVPAELLSDGVQTFVIRDGASGDRLGHFTIVTGVPLEDDIRAELDLLRAELDMLKKAFRRHCLETGA